jgi:electron transfer flavoprotein alpha subunit
MTAEAHGIWVVLPAGVGHPGRVIAEVLGEAKRLADDTGTEAVAVSIGAGEPDEAPDDLASWGAARILQCRASELGTFHPERFAAATAAAIRARVPQVVLFPGTSIGVDLGLRTALIMKRRFMSGCVDFAISDDNMRVTRPAAGGALQTTELIAEAPYLVSLIPDTVGSALPEAGRVAVLDEFDCPAPPATSLRDGGFAPGDPKTIDLVHAEIIVAGGRGAGGAEGFAVIEEVANLVGGSVGASRPAVEAGWAPYERQVGQTGRTVSPKLYMACGISGATQHLAGMRESTTVITINTDAAAPINSVAKLAVVGDVQEVLAALARMLRERRVARAA